jgi:hypothetical protein
LRIDQYVLQNGHTVFVGYDTVMSDRILHFHRSGAWIGESYTDRKPPPIASSGSTPLRIGAAGSGGSPIQTPDKVPSSTQITAHGRSGAARGTGLFSRRHRWDPRATHERSPAEVSGRLWAAGHRPFRCGDVPGDGDRDAHAVR